MALHNIDEAQKLIGKSRMTLYRKMANGVLSYSVDKDDRRKIETSELVRVFGELKDTSQPQTVQDEMAEMSNEIKMLRREVAELKSAILSIEDQRKPSITSALRKRVVKYLSSFD